MTAIAHDDLEDYDRIYLEKLRLAADVILQLGKDQEAIPVTLEVELWTFRDRVERALLMVPAPYRHPTQARHHPGAPAGTPSRPRRLAASDSRASERFSIPLIKSPDVSHREPNIVAGRVPPCSL